MLLLANHCCNLLSQIRQLLQGIPILLCLKAVHQKYKHSTKKSQPVTGSDQSSASPAVRFSTQTLLAQNVSHTDALTHRHLHTQTPVSIPQHTDLLTQQHLLFTDAFPHKRFYADAVRKDAVTNRRHIYTQKSFHTQSLTIRRFYTQKLLRTNTFTHRLLYTHQKSQFYFSVCRSTFTSCEMILQFSPIEPGKGCCGAC